MKRAVTSILRSHPGRFLSHHMFDAVTKTHLALVDTSSSFLASPVLSCVSAGTADPQPGIPSVAEQGCFRRPEHGGVGDDRVQTYVRAPFLLHCSRRRADPGCSSNCPEPSSQLGEDSSGHTPLPGAGRTGRSYKRIRHQNDVTKSLVVFGWKRMVVVVGSWHSEPLKFPLPWNTPAFFHVLFPRVICSVAKSSLFSLHLWKEYGSLVLW